ncbi:MAG: DUF1080 domain-containing protein [Gemmataceae bacterium]
MQSFRFLAFVGPVVCVLAGPSLGGGKEDEKDFVRLFNGKDLAGWKTHPGAPGDWKVDQKILIGSGKRFSHLFTVKDDWKDVHVRVEARINAKGNSGVHARAPFAARLGDLGYEAQIADRAGERTGTLFIHRAPAVVVNDELAPPNTWFVEDLIVRDHRVIIRVNGKTVVDHVDKEGVWKSGHIALQMHDPSTFVQFKKVLAKELR